MLEEGGGSTCWVKRVHGGGEEGAWMLEREHMLDEGRKPPSTIGWKEGRGNIAGGERREYGC